MKQSKWWNLPSSNPTQTMHRRAMPMPHTEIQTKFSQTQDTWDKFLKGGVKTKYDKFFEPM